MIKRGRKSTSELTAPRAISILAEKRAEPPAELSEGERQIWLDVTSSKPAGWFSPDSLPLLVAYCKHAELARKIDDLLNGINVEGATDSEVLANFDRLLKARERQSAALVSLARAMRISQHALVHPRTAGKALTSGVEKPWEPA